MESLNFMLEHSTEIMQLCFGFGVLLVAIFVSRAAWVATRVLGKVDDLVDLFIEYIQKPLRVFLEIQKVAQSFWKWFSK